MKTKELLNAILNANVAPTYSYQWCRRCGRFLPIDLFIPMYKNSATSYLCWKHNHLIDETEPTDTNRPRSYYRLFYKEKAKAYYQKNRVRRSKYKKAYYEKNKELIREKNRVYYENNKKRWERV